jgi:DNA polymerase-3 subunit gamma/tau
MAMVQSRQALLEQAIHQALGSPRQLVLEGGGQATMPDAAAAQAAPQVAAPVAPAVAPAVAPPTQERAPAPSGAIDAKAQRLAEFFNGEVVSFDGELDDNPGPDSQAA